MAVKDLREKKKEELAKLLKEARLELGKLRLEKKMESLADRSKIEKKRREIAKILTILKEKKVLGEIEGSVKDISTQKKEEETSPGKIKFKDKSK